MLRQNGADRNIFPELSLRVGSWMGVLLLLPIVLLVMDLAGYLWVIGKSFGAVRNGVDTNRNRRFNAKRTAMGEDLLLRPAHALPSHTLLRPAQDSTTDSHLLLRPGPE